MFARRSAVLLVVSLLLPNAFLVAQTALSGTVAGVIVDAQQAILPQAHLMLADLQSGAVLTTDSDPHGRFRFLGLAPGRYEISAFYVGFAEFRRPLAIEVGRTNEIRITLAVAGVSESMEVSEKLPTLNLSDAELSSNIGSDEIDTLPINGRRWSDFALLTPTAAPDGDYGLLSFRGVNGLANRSTVDGASNHQAFFSEERGRTRLNYVLTQAAVREFQVNLSNYSALYGHAAGAVINAVTRSGGQHFHADGFYYIRDNALAAADSFTVVPTQNANGTWSSTKIKPADRRQQFGASFGGPLQRDRLFYFVAIDAQRRNYPAVAAAEDASQLFAPPCVIATHYALLSSTNRAAVQICSRDEIYTLTRNLAISDDAAVSGFLQGQAYLANLLGPVPRQADHSAVFLKVDYRAATRQHFTISYNRTRWSATNGTQSQPVVERGRNSFGFDGVKVDTLTARLASILTPHVVSELRYSWSRDFEFETPNPPAYGEPATANGMSPSIALMPDSEGFTFGTPTFLPRRAFPQEQSHELAETVSWSHGRHLLRFGFDLNYVRDRVDQLYADLGSYYYDYRDNFFADLYQWRQTTGTQFRGYADYVQGFGQRAWRLHTWDAAFYAQDDLRFGRWLTLNLGLRYEFEKLPSAQAANAALPQTARLNTDWNNLAPRVGFALQLTRDGRTVLRGGYGMFFGRISNATVFSALSDTGLESAQRSYYYEPCRVVYGIPQPLGCPLGPVFPAVQTTDPYATSSGGNVVEFARHLQTPQIHQIDLIVERELARHTVLSTAFLLSLGRQLTNFVDTNLDEASRINVNYIFGPDYYTGVAGPYDGHSLTVPVYTARLNPNFERITEVRSNVNSTYTALVVQLNRTTHNGLGWRLNYTWSHALDNGQNSTAFYDQNATLSATPFVYSFDGVAHTVRRPDYGDSSYDVRHRLVASLHWSPRLFASRPGWRRAVLDHWTLAPILRISSDRPFSEYISGNAPDNLVSNELCIGCSGYMGSGGVRRLPFFARNHFRYPTLSTVDLRLSRKIELPANHHLELLAEAFNLFNHSMVLSRHSTMYSTYNDSLTLNANRTYSSSLEYDSDFLQPRAANNSIYRQREVQLGVKFRY